METVKKNGLRKCGIYTKWNSIQPQRKMKFCHSGRAGEHLK
jgi:hypothetical protein